MRMQKMCVIGGCGGRFLLDRGYGLTHLCEKWFEPIVSGALQPPIVE